MFKIGTNLDVAEDLLRQGGLVAIPTETVYGLAANALDKKAVLRIFEAKNRPLFDPLIIHTDTREKVRKWVTAFPEWAELLAAAFWPGPLTLLLPRRMEIPDLVTSGLPHVAVRIPRHPLTLQLLARLDFPLAAPSANPFGYVSPTRPDHVAAQLYEQVDYILDGGACEVGLESTIVGMEEGRIIIYRMGGLAQEDIEKKVGKVYVKEVLAAEPLAPGMLKSHYAPRKKVYFGEAGNWFRSGNVRLDKAGVISFRKKYDYPDYYQRVLSPSGNLDEAAFNLFGALRELDETDADYIVTEVFPDSFLGKAINERLKRAASAG
jgi:L-threonylcarbamoyladenylate synthase